MRAKYVLNEVLVGLWRNVTMTVAMIITMSISLTMLGAAVLSYRQVEQMKDVYYGKIQVSIFLRKDVTEAQRSAVEAGIKGSPLMQSYVYEDRKTAFENFKKLWAESPEFINSIGPDALPESFRVKLKNPEKYQEFADGIKGQQGIQDVIDQRSLLDKVFQIFNAVQLGALLFAAFMAVAALMLVGNTIQVAAYSKRREVAVMKLVGASNWFIQSPFVLEAVAAGLIGSLIGFGFLFAIKQFLLEGQMQALANVLTKIPAGDVWLMLPLLAGTATVFSAVTAWITLRFYIKV